MNKTLHDENGNDCSWRFQRSKYISEMTIDVKEQIFNEIKADCLVVCVH